MGQCEKIHHPWGSVIDFKDRLKLIVSKNVPFQQVRNVFTNCLAFCDETEFVKHILT